MASAASATASAPSADAAGARRHPAPEPCGAPAAGGGEAGCEGSAGAGATGAGPPRAQTRWVWQVPRSHAPPAPQGPRTTAWSKVIPPWCVHWITSTHSPRLWQLPSWQSASLEHVQGWQCGPQWELSPRAPSGQSGGGGSTSSARAGAASDATAAAASAMVRAIIDVPLAPGS
jgi:hypothetical protein